MYNIKRSLESKSIEWLFKLFIVFFFLVPKKSYSNHIIGGEIYWECLSSGSFVFKTKVYVDCTGGQYYFLNHQLEIIGNPLPRNALNNALSSITMKPDSIHYLATNQGDISPNCSPLGAAYSCANRDLGSIQEYLYYSDTIQLRGVPPVNGWKFFISPNCCRPATENLNISLNGNLILRSVMHGNGTPVDTCYDSSPKFAQSPDYLYCRWQWSNGKITSMDIDGDSLVYRFDRTFAPPISSPNSVPYVNGYSYNNPTPDVSIHPANEAAILDNQSGLFDFRVSSSSGIKKYWISTKIEAYRNGSLLSITHREMPIMIADCPNLSLTSPNYSPQVNLPFGVGKIPDTAVLAGTYLNFPIYVIENQIFNNSPQVVTTRVYGEDLSKNLSDSTFCNVKGDTLCATLSNSFTNNNSNFIYERSTQGSDTLGFSWQTDCQDLSISMDQKKHYFTVRVKDDFCPVPAISYQVFSVTVLPNPSLCGAVTGASEIGENSVLSIYPNPTEGRVTIDRNRSSVFKVQVFDIRGKLVQEGILDQEQKSLLLPQISGIYILRFTDSNGAVSHHKVIKN